MADKINNPVAFNPDTMTVSQLKQVADFARTLFENLDRNMENEPEQTLHYIQGVRDDFNRRWHGLRKDGTSLRG
jgi:hypothetical protein